MHAGETDIFKSLGDPTRRGLFERLVREGDLAVTALADGAGISQPAASQHLAVLKQAGLVEGERSGRTILYRAAPAGLAPLTDWLAIYAVFWRERIDRLETLLKEMDP